jgi:hypothetical protein
MPDASISASRSISVRSPAVRAALAAMLAAACGDSTHPAAPDARPPPGCTYAELADGTNDLTTIGTAEPTGITISPAAGPPALCGQLDPGHHDAPNRLVDVDAYAFEIPAPGGDVAISITGGGLAALEVELLLVNAMDQTEARAGVVGNHAIAAVRALAPGPYRAVVLARAPAPIAAPVPYQIAVGFDAPDLRCPRSAAAASYTEAADGAANDGNDVIEVRYASAPRRRLTPLATDAPEPTALLALAGTRYRITGESGAANAADEYVDRDTYQFRTGATTDQLTLRVDWAAPTADLDFFVFPAGATAELASGMRVATTGGELATFAALPDTDYWLWVGAYDGSTGQPVAYDATICGERFAP